MDKTTLDITHTRLFEAAEAALRGAIEVAEKTGRPSPYPADLVGSPMEPACLIGFTRAEIEAACEFLVRVGVFYKADSVRR